MALSTNDVTSDAVSPLVSIIIPAYGRPRFLREAVASVLLGGHENIQVIVVDDGSPVPVSNEIADLIASNTIRYHRQQNRGTATARNTGASIAQGEFLMFLDDDDMVVPGSITRRVTELAVRPDVAGVFGRSRSFSEATAGFQPDIELPVEHVDRWVNMSCCQLISPGQALIRASAFRAVGGFATDCVGSDDWDLWIRLCARGGMWRMNDFALSYRLHPGNFSNRLIAMAIGASRVASRARSMACPQHRPTASFLTRSYVSSLYGSKLQTAVPTLVRQGAWGAALRHSLMRSVLQLRTLWARIEFKIAVIRVSHRWSIPDAPMKLTGRDCTACEQIR